jgi:hypothetical protein
MKKHDAVASARKEAEASLGTLDNALKQRVERLMNQCPKCGTELAETGAPIWETYCPNKECSHDWDEFAKGLRVIRESWQSRTKAARDLIEKLRKTGQERQRTTAHDNPKHYLHVVAQISNADGKLMLEAADELERLLNK